MASTALDHQETDDAAEATAAAVARTREEEEKRAALLEPGLTWHEWTYYRAIPWWLGIALLTVDGWIVVTWFDLGSAVGLVLSLAAAIYLEFLLYRYLWYRPDPALKRPRGPFHPTWFRPVEFGRWTPEADSRRRGGPVPSSSEAPRPEEFL